MLLGKGEAVARRRVDSEACGLLLRVNPGLRAPSHAFLARAEGFCLACWVVSSSKPHDALFKHVFSEVENAASILRSAFPPKLAARFDWSSLRSMPASVVDKHLLDRHADLRFEVRLDDRNAYLYVLFEHQSSSDPLMPFWILGYLVRIWEWWLKDHAQAERLPAIVPIVVHHSESGYSFSYRRSTR